MRFNPLFLKLCLIVSLVSGVPAPVYADTVSADNKGTPQTVETLLAAQDNRVQGTRINSKAVAAFYAERENKPAWAELSPDNKEFLLGFLKSFEETATYHGLAIETYPMDLLRKMIEKADPADAAAFDILVSDTMLKLATDLHDDGRKLELLYAGWPFQRDPMDMPKALAKALADESVSAFVMGLPPKTADYTFMVRALQTYRAMAQAGGWKTMPSGPALKSGLRDPRVAQLRHRLVAEHYLEDKKLPKDASVFFDDSLTDAVKTYQRRNGLTEDGVVGSRMIAALNIPVEDRINQIRANMDRMRAMPDDLPDRYIRVNIADATMDIIEDDKVIYHSIVVVGKVDRKTPFINSTIRNVIFNPTWSVPRSIAVKDILPKLRKDPHYLQKQGLVILGRDQDPYGMSIDWAHMRDKSFTFGLRQSPGDLNSLGRLKFDFDNSHAVYMHGTPHAEAFDKPVRFLSSGCVRLPAPDEVAAVLLKPNHDAWDAQRINATLDAEKTRWVKLEQPIPILIIYDTAFLSDNGELHFRPDGYGYDKPSTPTRSLRYPAAPALPAP